LLTSRLAFVVALLGFVSVFCSCASPPRSASNLELPSETVARGSAALRVGINTAAASELEKLPGIGRGLAERIVAYREEHGPFRRVEHLMMVRGISERKFRELQPLVSVE
jgi:competence ComEA-like helix-hairpin-helix protein